ncbi:MAG: hypothetical protein KF787_12655 [Phycisphaeraceae bacterium]|nr:hypothetical protein [Phycisphaerae bacterium]MBX3393487.1 hypothetical protein [Phycisphaeraceae bacterium]
MPTSRADRPDRSNHDRAARAVRSLAPALFAALSLAVTGCSPSRLTGDHAADLKNPQIRSETRAEALTLFWDQSGQTPESRRQARALLKDMVWSQETPGDLRIRIMEKLLGDPDPENLADSRAMARLMIPKEPSRAMLVYLCSVVGARGWDDFTGPLIRSYARPLLMVPDKERSERGALLALHPDRSVERTVYEAFVRPPSMDEIPGINTTERLRTDAWDLLGRLDPSGTIRQQALAETAVPADDTILAAIQRASREAGVIPISGSEIPWLVSLLSSEKTRNTAWWSEVSSLSSRLSGEQRAGLCLRHLEPLRWASRNRPAWIDSTRSSLAATLESRLKDRRSHRRAIDQTSNRKPVRQDLDTWRARLSWGDLLAILVIDEAVSDPGIRSNIFRHMILDHQDKQTEYGGIIEDAAHAPPDSAWGKEAAASTSGWRARLFPPRTSQRYSDEQFVASADMMNAADLSLVIYHFHAQRFRNEVYAGPSDGDLEFATSSGRSCIVFTCISEETLNVDYYQPGGAIIDLGDIRKP